jgi:hypothetical protein
VSSAPTTSPPIGRRDVGMGDVVAFLGIIVTTAALVGFVRLLERL